MPAPFEIVFDDVRSCLHIEHPLIETQTRYGGFTDTFPVSSQ
jgi:hypothetical protein